MRSLSCNEVDAIAGAGFTSYIPPTSVSVGIGNYKVELTMIEGKISFHFKIN